ncbi:MAG TPA: hypothetical protein VFB15_03930 [Candidatus Binataceae bacterium]|jgi:hypothetical protein|nr:hypothetical protein [Candidatus Binataceae bacterium]
MSELINQPPYEPEGALLPDDFAHRVMLRVGRIRRRRMIVRRTFAAAAALLVVAVPLTLREHWAGNPVSVGGQSSASALEADYEQLARVEQPPQLTDYLMPAVDADSSFAAEYSGGLWTDYSAGADYAAATDYSSADE